MVQCVLLKEILQNMQKQLAFSIFMLPSMWRCRLLPELYTDFENQGASKNIEGEASGDRIYRNGHAQYCTDSEETNRTLSPHLRCIDI